MAKSRNLIFEGNGFSLIEIMVTIAILSFVSVGMFSLLNLQLRQMNHLEFLGKREQLRSTLIGQFLTRSENCRCLFNGASNFPIAGTKDLRGYQPPTAIGLYQLPSCNMIRPFINQSGFDNLHLESVTLENITHVSGTQTGEFVVAIRNTKHLAGIEILPLRIPVAVSTLPASATTVRFNGCSSRSEGGNLESVLQTVQDFETTECIWSDSVHEVIASCPPDRALISCSGGPGDQDESREGHWIMPNYTNNTCTLTVAMPRCNGPERPHTYQKVVASCYLRP